MASRPDIEVLPERYVSIALKRFKKIFWPINSDAGEGLSLCPEVKCEADGARAFRKATHSAALPGNGLAIGWNQIAKVAVNSQYEKLYKMRIKTSTA